MLESVGEKTKDVIVRECVLKADISGSVVAWSSSSSSGGVWEPSNTPMLPSLSPAKMMGLSSVGWKPSAYTRWGVILISAQVRRGS